MAVDTCVNPFLVMKGTGGDDVIGGVQHTSTRAC